MTEPDHRITGLRVAKVLVWLVYAYFLVATVILTLAFFLLLFNASTSAGFTEWVYRSAERFLDPFRGIFPTVEAGNGSVFSAAVLFAIIMYGIFAMLVHGVVYWLDDKITHQRYKAQQAANAAYTTSTPPPTGTTAVQGTPPAEGAVSRPDPSS